MCLLCLKSVFFFFILYSFTPPTLTEGLPGSGVGTRFAGVKEKMTQSWPPEVCHLVATQTHQTLVTWQVDLHELGVVSPARGHLRLPRGCQWVGWGLRKQSFELRLGKQLYKSLPCWTTRGGHFGWREQHRKKLSDVAYSGNFT